MKGFKFKLQSVLDARKKKLEDAQIEFAKAKNRLHQEMLLLAELMDELEQTILSLENVLNAVNIDSTNIFIHQNYIIKLKEDIENQKQLVRIAETELEKRNHVMLETLKDKKIMEKLKEKSQNEFREKINRQEMLAVDEIATCRHKKSFR